MPYVPLCPYGEMGRGTGTRNHTQPPRVCASNREIIYMSKIDEWTIYKIKEASDIVDVVGDYVHLNRSGAEYTGHCPFHSDRHTGSFMVSPKTKKNIATCFPCGKTWDPIQWIMDIERCTYPDALHRLGKKYGIFINDDKPYVKPSAPRILPPPPPELPKRLWPNEWVKQYAANDSDTFVSWLRSIPWDDAQRARIDKVLGAYRVGHSHFTTDWGGRRETHDFTIFWQCDEQARLHNGHFMKYRCDGHRIKDKDGYNTTWVHSRMKYAKDNPFDDDKEQPSYCLFGQHLMTVAPDAVINIVESEKTAIIMSIAHGGMRMNLWMACCGINNLTNRNQLLKPLIEQGKHIVLYPDHDGVEAWQNAARILNYPRLDVNTKPVTEWWTPEDGAKADIADIVLRMIRTKEPMKFRPPNPMREVMTDWAKEYPAFQSLMDKFDLEPINMKENARQ